MDVVSRLLQIVWMSASTQAALVGNTNLPPAMIQNTFSVTSTQVAPANNNVFSDRARHLAVASEFRAQEQAMMADARVKPMEIKTPEKIKTEIFSSVGRNLSMPSVMVNFKVEATVKSDKRFAERETVAVTTSSNVVPFKRPILSLNKLAVPQ